MSECKTIRLSYEDIQRCFRFSEESAKTQQDIEFGEHSTAPRLITEIARDNLIGKMAELAVSQMLRREYGIHVPVNWDIYERGEWDDCDFDIHGWKIDIKSTRIGRWLMFEQNKLNVRLGQEKLPDAVFWCRTNWNRETDTPIGTVELIGAISLKALIMHPECRRLNKGECIPGTNVRLQAANLAIHESHLNSNWDEIIRYIMKESPPDQSGFHL